MCCRSTWLNTRACRAGLGYSLDDLHAFDPDQTGPPANNQTDGGGGPSSCAPPPTETCCTRVLRDATKTLRVRFGPGGPRAISNLSVWALSESAAGAGSLDALEVTAEVATAGSSTGCLALPRAADPARPGWAAGQMVCGVGGDSVQLAFAGAEGPLGVRLCTVAVGAADGPPAAASLAVRLY